MSAPAVAVTSDGKSSAAAWKDVREGAPRVWWAAGTARTFAADAPVADAGAADGPMAERDHPSIAVDARGRFWIAWEEGGRAAPRIRARRLPESPAPGRAGAAGATAPEDAARDVTESAAGSPAYPVVACGAGLVVVAWETSGPPDGERVLLRVLHDAPR